MKGKYKNSIVAYMDVLGFREKIHNAGSNSDEINSIYSMFSDCKQFTALMMKNSRKMSDDPIQCKIFSDSIVISTAGNSSISIFTVLFNVAFLQALLTTKGFFLRGSITAGDHYEDNNILFGPAMIRAYDLEKVAHWPRVVLDPDMFTLPGVTQNDFLPPLGCRNDPDGLLYVDYLTIFFEYSIYRQKDQKLKGKDFPEGILIAHRHAIDKALKTDSVKSELTVLLKYQMLVNYHNTIIQELINRYAMNSDYVHKNYTLADFYLEKRSKTGRKVGFFDDPEKIKYLYKRLVNKLVIDSHKEFAPLYCQ